MARLSLFASLCIGGVLILWPVHEVAMDRIFAKRQNRLDSGLAPAPPLVGKDVSAILHVFGVELDHAALWHFTQSLACIPPWS